MKDLNDEENERNVLLTPMVYSTKEDPNKDQEYTAISGELHKDKRFVPIGKKMNF